MSDAVKPYVDGQIDDTKSLIANLADKVKADSTALAKYADAQIAIAAVKLQTYADSVAKDKDAILAGELKNAYEDADGLLNDSIDKVAANLAAVKNAFEAATNFEDKTSLAGRFAAIEDFFKAEDADAVSIANLAAKITEDETFTEALKEAANEANGEILGMITAINLFANQHMAECDEYGKVRKVTTDGEVYEYEYTYGYDNFDHYLTFVYTIEQGLDYDYCEKVAKTASWNYPDGLIKQLKGIQSVKDDKIPADYDFKYDEGGFTGSATDYDFVDGRFRTFSDSILVRVSPTNADLRKAEIALLNSKGENIVDAGLVEIEDVQKYTREDYITRAAEGNETGLWVIKFKLKDEQVGDLFDKYATYKGGSIVYAVAVKNAGVTVDEEGEVTSDADRYVVSEYDLSLDLDRAWNAYNFRVNGTSINDIHNRYIMPEQSENGYTSWTDDPVNFTKTFRYELTWSGNNPCCDEPADDDDDDDDDDDAETIKNTWYEYCWNCAFDQNGQTITPDCENRDMARLYNIYGGFNTILFKEEYDQTNAEQGTEDCTGVNTVDRLCHSFSSYGNRSTSGVDNRHIKEPLGIEFSADQAPAGEDGEWAAIKIQFPRSICGYQTRIRGFFVTLDNHFAIESDNSEINAWATYEFKNVAKYNYDHGKKETNASYLNEDEIVLFDGNEGTIYVKDAHNLNNGDVIGFRVHAVNLDGTFTDPDGRAFYVRVGKLEKNRKMAFHVTTTELADIAWALQDSVAADNNQIIVDFNKEQADNKSDDRFFNRDPYNTDQYDAQNYQVVYYWRGENPAIRTANSVNTTEAQFPVAGTGTRYYNEKYGYGAMYTVPGSTDVISDGVSPEDVFLFMYNQDPKASIDENSIWLNPNDENNSWNLAYNYGGYGSTSSSMPNKLTTSVKAGINKNFANRLVDGATYHITMEIRRMDSQAGNGSYKVINTYDIDITKVMPTGMPEEFSVKSNQLTNGVLKVYLRPLYQTLGTSIKQTPVAGKPWQNTWKTYAAEWIKGADDKATAFAEGFDADEENKQHMYHWGIDARPYNLEGIFNGLYMTKEDGTLAVNKDYFFVFTESGNYSISEDSEDDAENKDEDAIVTYNSAITTQLNPTELSLDLGYYNVPQIHWSHIGDTKEIKAGYVYRKISAKMNATNTAFLAPATVQEGYESLNTSIQNQDWVINPVTIGEEYGNNATSGKLEANYLCAFDEAVKNYNTRGITGSTANAKKFEYNEDIVIGADSTQFNIKSSLWFENAASDATKKLQAYFNAKFPTALKLAKDKDDKDIDAYNASKINLEKNAAVAMTLKQMLADNYLWVDTTSLAVKATSPAGYKYADYYFAPYWCDKDGKQKGFDKLTDGLYIGMKRFSRDAGLPDFQSPVTFEFSFDVRNIWFHKTTITLTVEVNKPNNITGARKTR